MGLLSKVIVRENSLGMKFVFLPTGRFLMGHPKMADPVHPVTISGFWIGQYEVTNHQFEQFRKRPRPAESLQDNQPVTRVSWEEATAFCRWLSHREAGSHYRLPTEAEWEYAARGGREQKLYPWGDNENWNGKANFGTQITKPVGSYAPNDFDLYDMAGNVEEWVSDWYSEEYYKKSPVKDPTGPRTPPKDDRSHVLRGGYFGILEGPCWLRRPSFADTGAAPTNKNFSDAFVYDGSGFRVALAAPMNWDLKKARILR